MVHVQNNKTRRRIEPQTDGAANICPADCVCWLVALSRVNAVWLYCSCYVEYDVVQQKTSQYNVWFFVVVFVGFEKYHIDGEYRHVLSEC